MDNLGYENNLQKLHLVLNNISTFLTGGDRLFCTFGFTKILSHSKFQSSIQDLKVHYCPRSSKNMSFSDLYKNYDAVENVGCPHLSALHFPTGGYFSYLEGDIFSMNSFVLKALSDHSMGLPFLRSLKYCKFYKLIKCSQNNIIIILFSIAPKERRFHGIKFPVLRCQSKVLNLEPNTTILFRILYIYIFF